MSLNSSYRLKRDNEQELLFRGRAYLRAIKAFYMRNRQYPRALGELGGKGQQTQFIRQLYKDPMTGGDFKLILSPDGKIIGV